jgi:hypothetical protein
MTIKAQTFWYTVYECDYCGEETEDPFIDDEGDDLCGKCVQNFAASLGYLIILAKMEEMGKRQRSLPV